MITGLELFGGTRRKGKTLTRFLCPYTFTSGKPIPQCIVLGYCVCTNGGSGENFYKKEEKK